MLSFSRYMTHTREARSEMNATAARANQWLLDVPPSDVTDDEWRAWTCAQGGLQEFAGMNELLDAHRTSGSSNQNRILAMMFALASTRGGDFTHAAEWACWMMRPGVLRLVRSLAGTTDPRELQQIVAGALWIEIRSWNPSNSGTASAMLRNLRSQVLQELERSLRDHTYPPTLQLIADPQSVSGARYLWQRADDEEDPEEIVTAMLAWAIERNVISESDRRIMSAVLATMDEMPSAQFRNTSGLCSMEVSIAAGASIGLAGSSVRRATRRTINRLSAIAPLFLQSA